MARLTDAEQLVLNIIDQHPGLRPDQMYQHHPLKDQVKANTMSPICSNLMHKRAVNRVKAATGASYLYYSKGHALPEGYTAWNNRMIRHVQKKRQTAEHKQPVKPKRKDTVSIQDGGVLIVLQWGERESITVSVTNAKEIYARLHQLFGE